MPLPWASLASNGYHVPIGDVHHRPKLTLILEHRAPRCASNRKLPVPILVRLKTKWEEEIDIASMAQLAKRTVPPGVKCVELRECGCMAPATSN